jgi:biopolymer transport protein ExbB
MIGSILLQTQSIGSTAADTVVNAAQTVTNTLTQTPPAPTVKQLSAIDLVMAGGYVMYPIAILLILTIYVLIERIIVINRAARNDRRFMDNIRDYIVTGNVDSARALCKSNNTPQARVIEKGINRIGKPMKDIETAMESEGRVQITKLEARMGVLNIIGRIAPMLGFVGTIIGVIKIFYDISLSNTISIDVISNGLYQKMITSASGLIVGIIAFAGYHWLNLIVEKIIARVEASAVQFVDILSEPTK